MNKLPWRFWQPQHSRLGRHRRLICSIHSLATPPIHAPSGRVEWRPQLQPQRDARTTTVGTHPPSGQRGLAGRRDDSAAADRVSCERCGRVLLVGVPVDVGREVCGPSSERRRVPRHGDRRPAELSEAEALAEIDAVAAIREAKTGWQAHMTYLERRHSERWSRQEGKNAWVGMIQSRSPRGCARQPRRIGSAVCPAWFPSFTSQAVSERHSTGRTGRSHGPRHGAERVGVVRCVHR